MLEIKWCIKNFKIFLISFFIFNLHTVTFSTDKNSVSFYIVMLQSISTDIKNSYVIVFFSSPSPTYSLVSTERYNAARYTI